MILLQMTVLLGLALAEWIEIPFMKPNSKQDKKSEADSHLHINHFPIKAIDNSTSIIIKPKKSSVKEVFGTYAEPITEITKIKSPQEEKTQTKTNNFSKDENIKESRKENTGYETFLNILKIVQNNLMKNAHHSVKNKMDILTNLRDTLLYNIDLRMRQLWPFNDKKELRDSDDTHMEFPSNEGALMTIGFLTLAVFLVKLVLQVIHIIKNKKYYNTTGSPLFATFGKKKRSTGDSGLEDIQILQMIDEYKIPK